MRPALPHFPVLLFRGGTERSPRMESPRAEREPSPEEAAAAAESRELAMLREMTLHARREGKEPRVPDEQLRSNDQLQHDEVLLATFSDQSLLRLATWDRVFRGGWPLLIRHRVRRIRSPPGVACGLPVWSWDALGVPATSLISLHLTHLLLHIRTSNSKPRRFKTLATVLWFQVLPGNYWHV